MGNRSLELVLKAQSGDESARDVLARSYLPVIYSCASRHNSDYDEAVSAGHMAFMRALNNFDASIKIKGGFGRYFSWWIHNYIGRVPERNGFVHKTVDSVVDQFGPFVEEEHARTLVRSAVRYLPLRQRYAVTFFFGLYGIKPLSLYEIGQTLGVTKQRAAKIKDNGVKALKKLLCV